MKMKLPGIVLALACCGASAAKADWEYTKWGMTPQQVVSASKNLAKENSDLRPDSDGNVSKLVAPYQSGKFHFEAQFGFDAADRLSSVTLVLSDKSMAQGICEDLEASVTNAYGRPQDRDGAMMQYGIETWQDQKNKNNVKYTVLYGTGCYVQYSAVKSAGAY